MFTNTSTNQASTCNEPNCMEQGNMTRSAKLCGDCAVKYVEQPHLLQHVEKRLRNGHGSPQDRKTKC